MSKTSVVPHLLRLMNLAPTENVLPAPPRKRSRRRAIWVVASLPCCALVGGCAVNGRQEEQLYRDVLDAEVPHVAPYQLDEPLSLRRALALSNQSDEELGLRGEDYVQALINKNRVVAAFLPTVSFEPSFTIEQRARGNAATSTGPGGTGIGTGQTAGGSGTTSAGASSGGGGFRDSGKVSTRLEAPVVGNINLFRGGGDAASLRAAEADIARRRELLLDVQATVLLNVAQVYFQVLRSEQSANVLRNSLNLQEARLSDVQQQFKNGLAIQLSVAQTRAQTDATRVTLVQAESDARNGRNTLASLVGTSSLRGALTNGFVLPPHWLSEPQYEQIALATRKDLRAAHAAVVVARENVDVAFAQYYPSVSLNVTGFLYREFFTDASKWSSVLSANFPIFSAGIIEADVRAAWSRLRQALLTESGTRRDIIHDVQVGYENLVTTDRRIAELADEVQASEEAYRQSQNAFQNSLAINLDVLTAQDQLLNAQLLLTSAEFDRTVFYIDLLRAAGQLQSAVARGPETIMLPAPPSVAPMNRPTTAGATTSSAPATPASAPSTGPAMPSIHPPSVPLTTPSSGPSTNP